MVTEMQITVCACAHRQVMRKNELIRLVSALQNAGNQVRVVPDLCAVATSDAGRMRDIARTWVVACYPRAVEALFDMLQVKVLRTFDVRNHPAEHVLAEMGVLQPAYTPVCSLSAFEPDVEQAPAWFPVIDGNRCTHCGKCHDFCLFGVYAMRDGEVTVLHPEHCKDNCPACARLCPAKAVIFPKYGKSPINGGLDDEELFTGLDTKELYNAALKHKLEERRAKVSLFKKDEQ